MPRAVLLKQRARRRRTIIGFTFFTAACVFLTGTSYVYLQHQLGQIQRVTLPNLVEDQPGEVMNVLLVGSDSRDGSEGTGLQAPAGEEEIAGQRSDTMMVLHIDPRQEQAAILSIPRDIVVPIAGTDRIDRVNVAFSLGGAEGLIATVQQSLGITINHYVEVDFVGFKDIVDTVGGLEIYLPHWVRDSGSGLDLGKVGCVSVNGSQALSFVRSRHYEELIDGKWVLDPTGDFGRISRQQDFIRRMMKKALSTGITNPIQLNRLIGIGIKDVKIDQTLSTKDITLLARRFSNLDPDNVLLYTLPAVPAFIGGKSAMQLMESEAEPFIEFMNGNVSAVQPVVTTPPGATPTNGAPVTVAPGDIEVRVLNGIGTAGAAGIASTALKSAGYTISGTGDSPRTARTTIRHPAAALAKAQTLQAALTSGAELSADADLTDGGVVLVLGADYDGLKTSSHHTLDPRRRGGGHDYHRRRGLGTGRLGCQGKGPERHRHRRRRGQGVDRAEGGRLHGLGHRRLVAGRAHHHPSPGRHPGAGQAAAGVAAERCRAGGRPRPGRGRPRARARSRLRRIEGRGRRRHRARRHHHLLDRAAHDRRHRSQPRLLTPASQPLAPSGPTADTGRPVGGRFAGGRPVPLPWSP